MNEPQQACPQAGRLFLHDTGGLIEVALLSKHAGFLTPRSRYGYALPSLLDLFDFFLSVLDIRGC